MSVNPENPKKPEKEEKEEKETKGKLSETLETLKKSENIEDLISYAQSNTQDTIAYVLMGIGIIWMFFQNFYGGLLVGIVGGFYFSKEIMGFVKSYNEIIITEGMARSIILGGTLLALFIMAPGIFIGAALIVAIKVMLKMQ